MRMHIFTKEHKNLIRLSKLGSKNNMWKGDSVQYGALHDWVRDNLSKPELCEICNTKKSYDLANVTGIYNRDFSNWKYLCRSCHMKLDYKMGFRKKYYNPHLSWLGRKHSPETKEKLRLIALGRKHSRQVN